MRYITNVQKKKEKVPPGQRVENINFFFSVTISFHGKCGIGTKLENKDLDLE